MKEVEGLTYADISRRTQEIGIPIPSKTIEKKIKNELEKMMKDERDEYEKFFSAFGIQLKYGVYSDYGMHKDMLKDLLLFKTSVANENKKVSYVSLKEYVERMKDGQSAIYYAPGESVEKIEMLPQTDSVKDKGYEILYLTENVDEFALKILMEYDGKKFVNICDNDLNLDTEDEKKALNEENESAKDMFAAMKTAIGEKVNAVRFTNKLKKHPVCLTSEGGISLEMEKTLNSMAGNNEKIKAQLVLEINATHPIAEKLKTLYNEDTETLNKYAKLLYTAILSFSSSAFIYAPPRTLPSRVFRFGHPP
jgi:molecular chaperone HtpG